MDTIYATDRNYMDGKCAAWRAMADEADGRQRYRHATVDEARRMAWDCKHPRFQYPPNARADRAFWLGYIRALRHGFPA